MPDAPEPPAWAPTPQRVGTLLWEHTRDTQDTAGESGVLVDDPQLGTFTEHTDPPLSVVVQLIEQACDQMAGLLEGHAPCNDYLVRSVRAATAYLAAALVDRAKDLQASASESSAYARFMAQWETESARVASQVVASCPFVPLPTDPPNPWQGGLRAVGVLPVIPNPAGWEPDLW